MNKEIDKIKICDECESPFVVEDSQMKNLCPECSSILYGYQNCEHIFLEQQCVNCNWNGNTSEYLRSLKEIP
jgi:predicted RNA-binding Zn-ribbon protein involved in translation (DUF1610 family)